MAPEVKISPQIPERSSAEPVVKDILRELGDNKTAKQFHFNRKFRGIDILLACRGDRDNFTISAKRFFNRERVRYFFQEGHFSQVAITIEPFPQAPFSERQEIFLSPSQANVTAEMVLYLIKSIKEEEQAFINLKSD